LAVIYPPKPNTRFVRLKNQLALFHNVNDHLSYWKRYWGNTSYLSSLIEAGAYGDLGEFQETIDRFVDKNYLVLEAGCGPGHLVAALTARGYQALGIDYEPDVVQFANEHLPNENIIQGNILSLGLSDASVGCYLSIGVVEHFVDGPLPALLEAQRVLRSDGMALISVPYLNPLRRAYMKALTSMIIEPTFSFHQYYFDPEDFKLILSQAGFTVIDLYPYAVEAFMIREHPVIARFWRSIFARERIKIGLRKLFRDPPNFIRYRYAHMMMYVCRPFSCDSPNAD
jgi:SAM-dependent methyltransferase